MFFKLSPTVRIWISKDELEIFDLIENSPEGQILRSSLMQEQYHVINRMVSKSVLWRKKLGEDILYGKTNIRKSK
jgi:hypothetical protein